jgi:beta-lactamase superfamily II metal-dependent hydrolase
MAPHHGSATGGADSLIDWANPEWIVISGSATRGVPLAATSSLAGRRWCHTARDGSLHFRLAEGRVEAWAWRSGWRPLDEKPIPQTAPARPTSSIELATGNSAGNR